MKIAVAGLGYVGLSNGVLLAQQHEIVALDVVAERVEMLNRKQSPIQDAELEDYLRHKPLNFRATLDPLVAFGGADYVIIATPTDYDPQSNQFNTKTVEVVIYEPALAEETFFRSAVVRDLDAFKQRADLIISNRMSDDLLDVAGKVYTRDIFGDN
jgi:UDP-glucose 6-dehydrogenase